MCNYGRIRRRPFEHLKEQEMLLNESDAQNRPKFEKVKMSPSVILSYNYLDISSVLQVDNLSLRRIGEADSLKI